MKSRQTDIALFAVWVLCLLLFSVSFMLMPLGGDTGGISAFSVTAGIIFWVSISAGIAIQAVLSRRRKNWLIRNRIRRSRVSQKIGLFTVFKNKAAIIADSVTVISLIGFIAVMIALEGRGYICYVLLSVFIFSFGMHGILNGKIYTYIANQNKLLESTKQEQANNSNSRKDKENG